MSRTWDGRDKAEIKKDAREVCAARKRHVEAYAALQANYKNFVNAFSDDRRLNLPDAVSNRKTSGSSVHGSQVRPHHRRP